MSYFGPIHQTSKEILAYKYKILQICTPSVFELTSVSTQQSKSFVRDSINI